MKNYLYALFVEHSILNIFWKNFHKIDEGVYRSAQMNPYSLKKYIKKYRIKTIITFRQDIDKSPLSIMEKKVCEEMGVEFIRIGLTSRRLPKKEKLIELKKRLEISKKPLLMHCKAGADRTSLASFLYLYWNGKIDKAKQQFSFLRFGHIKNSKAGIIDYCADKFLKSNQQDIIEWCENNRERLQIEFKPKGLFSFINDTLLKRE
jgi:protein tyrosine/serine phosphatase